MRISEFARVVIDAEDILVRIRAPLWQAVNEYEH